MACPMFDPATLNRAAHIIRTVSPSLPADAALRQELAANRNLTATARGAVSRVVFTYYRWLPWLTRSESLQRQLAEAIDLQGRFETQPGAVKPEALAALAVPAWLREEVELPAATLAQFQQEPTLWLRARPGTAETLAKELGNCEPATAMTMASALPPLRQACSAVAYRGPKDLFRTEAFQRGAFELQDLASQLVGHACAPEPGETWWDACAGEGGKTLHLADLMQNKGVIWASDRSARRLTQLKERFARARLFNFRTVPWEGGATPPTKTKFDGVLVDAPCSGVGTWQRNPHARWTTTPKDVAELAAVQARLLNHVTGSLKPGGRLIYAVCTLTRSETAAVVDAYTKDHPEMEPVPVFGAAPVPAGTSGLQVIWPHQHRSNGMAVAVWRRR